jgi:outer membrane receptor for Fe3+-dicitrate
VDLRSRPGADLVDFERGRVRPWTVFDVAVGKNFLKDRTISVATQLDIQNITGRRFAYNFGNPFSGTHFGPPRLWGARVKLIFH